MRLTEIAGLLTEAIGLDPASIGLGAVEHSIRRRMSISEFTDMDSYYNLLRASTVEMAALIEEIVVPETWFFRDSGAFEALKQIVTRQWNEKGRDLSLRLASLPCSTGEEPYSMAMTMLGAGLKEDCFCIDAIDVSEVAIRRAQEAIFTPNSFRGANLEGIQQYFTVEGNLRRLHDRVRNRVNFYQGNLLTGPEPIASRTYDIIFCRNLLIYLNDITRDRLINRIKRWLSPTGTLFVGNAEAMLVSQADFKSIGHSMSFAFHLSDSVKTSVCSPKLRRAGKEPNSVKKPLPTNSNRPPMPASVTSTLGQQDDKTNGYSITQTTSDIVYQEIQRLTVLELDTIQQLADKRCLVEAEKRCEVLLNFNSNSIPALYLMGFIKQANGDPDAAIQYIRKVLYLQPDHYDALLQMALLRDQQGEHTQATTLRDRLSRLQNRGKN